MFTASAFLAFALAFPGQRAMLGLGKKPYYPPPPPATTPVHTGIEVNVGPLPTDVGGPADVEVLRKAHLGATAEDALEFFRLRTPHNVSREKIDALITKLDGPDADAAHKQLAALGPASLPALRLAAKDIDEPTISARARKVLDSCTGDAASQLVINAARVLAAKKPEGAAQAILNYLPFAEDNASFSELEGALVAVSMPAGKPDAALLKALKDTNGIRRGTAAQVLCQVGGPKYYPPIRPLMKDPLPSVRLRVALGLVNAYDSEAVPVLIELVADLPPSLRGTAEEYLNNLAGEWAVSGPKGNDAISRKLRTGVWAAWWKNVDGKLLLDEFRSRTPGDDEREKIDTLIKQLDAKDAKDRDDAFAALLKVGKKAASQLRRASAAGHERISPFAAKALEAIEGAEPAPLPGVAPRLLALRKPEGAVEAILAYLPVAESEEVQGQLTDILASVGAPGGKAEEALVNALKDRSPVRRAAAAIAICRGKASEQYAKLRAMLSDKAPEVRVKVAEALASVGDKVGIPVIIAALKDLPLQQAWDAEELLRRIAGTAAPSESVSADADSRTRAHDAWAKWWKDSGGTVDLARVDFSNRDAGRLFLLEQYSTKTRRGQIHEITAGGKAKWTIGDLNYPNYATALRNGHVLIVEQQNRVTERDRTGKIHWDRYFSSVIHADRLPNGQTFIATYNSLMLVDKDGKTSFTHYYNINSILAARRFRDGSMAYVSYSGHYVRLDSKGKQVKSFNLPWGGFSMNGAAILPGDRVVASIGNFNKVAAFGPDTKQIWEASVQYPLAPSVTPSGRIFVVGNSQTVVYEIDRRGKIVKEMKGLDYRPFRVFRR